MFGIPAFAFLFGRFGEVEPSVICDGEHSFPYGDGVEFHGVGNNEFIIREELHQVPKARRAALLKADDVKIVKLDDIGDGFPSLVPPVASVYVFLTFPANVPRGVAEFASEGRNLKAN